MRFRLPLFALLFVVGAFALPHLAHASIPFFGPIIPAGNNVCPAGWGMLMTVINNIIELLLTLAIVFVAPLMIAYAGFLYVVNPFDPSGISKAKGILTNTIVGIVIALAGWMIVDAIMAVLYNPGGSLGTWSSLITSSGPECLPQKGALPQDPLDPTKTTPGVSTGTLNPPPAGNAGSACDPTVLQGLAPSLTTVQANTFACIAKPESSCGSNLQNYNWGKGSSAYGAFQVLLSTHSDCYENSACQTAAGVSGPLDCASGFSGGNPKPSKFGTAVVQRCMTAAANLGCSLQAAICVMQQDGGFSAWQADVNSAQQTGCITSGG